jgi:hypothetical protein
MGPRIFPFLYCLFPTLLPNDENSLVLDGDNNAWGIAIFPVKHKESANANNPSAVSSNGATSSNVSNSRSNKNSEDDDSIVGKATPRHAHIDGGRAAIFHRELTRGNSWDSTNEGATEPISLNEALMQVSR